jgi:hypothetical protein
VHRAIDNAIFYADDRHVEKDCRQTAECSRDQRQREHTVSFRGYETKEETQQHHVAGSPTVSPNAQFRG